MILAAAAAHHVTKLDLDIAWAIIVILIAVILAGLFKALRGGR